MVRYYKIRRICSSEESGDVFGITLPNQVMINHSGVNFSVPQTNNFIEFRNEVIEEVNKTFRILNNQLSPKQSLVMKQHWFELRDNITEIETPLSNALILLSGCGVKHK
jgi:hypothetical protein